MCTKSPNFRTTPKSRQPGKQCPSLLNSSRPATIAHASSMFLSPGVEGPTKNHSIGGKKRGTLRAGQTKEGSKEKRRDFNNLEKMWRGSEGARDRTAAAVSSERRRDGDEIKLNRRLRRNGIGRHAGASELKDAK